MRKNLKKVITSIISLIAVISAMSIGMGTVFADETGITYTGNELTPNITLYDEDVLLEKGVDYDLSYENNINVGQATIIVTFKGNYNGEKRITFNIIPKALTQSDVNISTIENYTFEDKAIEPKPTITFGDVTLVEDKDYTLEYENNISVGTATIKVTFIGNYSGNAKTTFVIDAKDLTNDNKLVLNSDNTIPSQIYTGEAIEPKPGIKYGDKVLEEGKDYILSYENNINVGEATVKVTFIGDYTGEKEYTFNIEKKAATADNTVITGIPDTTEYTGNEIKPELNVTVDGRILELDKDYTVVYENNVNIGEATVKVTFIGNYEGETSRTFTITPFVITDDNVKISTIADQIYTGSEITPEITVSIIRK